MLIIEPKLRVLSAERKNQAFGDKQMERKFLLSFLARRSKASALPYSLIMYRGINYYLSEKTKTRIGSDDCPDSGHLIQKHFTREMASTHLPLLVLHDA
jgi:hypothetical protein